MEIGNDEDLELEGAHRCRDALEDAAEQHGEDEEAAAAEKPWETLTGAKARAEMKYFQRCWWAATEMFYAQLASSTERLEAKRTPERG